jgi:cytochrome c oxidase subunit IV
MRKFRIVLIIIAVIVIIGLLTAVDYSNLIWSKNSESYLGIISMICVIIGMILSNRHEKRNLKKGKLLN